ncbi:hypothetical protein AB0269_13165 [Microbacterium sp. NPDC077644]|uniref:hypothetical protein n=1 Tax=Microbacterium sp. NPDC077644 TaxID=3155055 RepID=UPI00344FDCC5
MTGCHVQTTNRYTIEFYGSASSMTDTLPTPESPSRLLVPQSDISTPELQRRAYGPNQPPLSDAELAQLRSMSERSTIGPGAASVEEVMHGRGSQRQRMVAWRVAAGIGVVIAGFTGYALGSSTTNTIKPESEHFGNGIEVDPGDIRLFNDADCEPILSPDNGTLTGVRCVWSDGEEATLFAATTGAS